MSTNKTFNIMIKYREYGVTVWGNCSINLKKDIDKVQADGG